MLTELLGGLDKYKKVIQKIAPFVPIAFVVFVPDQARVDNFIPACNPRFLRVVTKVVESNPLIEVDRDLFIRSDCSTYFGLPYNPRLIAHDTICPPTFTRGSASIEYDNRKFIIPVCIQPPY